jgi:thiamine-phosphate pyrophosphorylase
MNSFHRSLLRKYFIMGSQDGTGHPEVILERAIKGGVTLFQYREKGAGSKTGEEKLQLGKRLQAICKEYSIPFIVNDDVELARRLDADGIHVGQDDYPVKEVRSQFPGKIIGLSISTQEELEKSPLDLVDYIGAGPMFPTTSKKDAKAVVGPEWIRTLREAYPDLPIVGIGGIHQGNAHLVLEAGADGVSFISAVTKAEDIEKAVREL